MPQRSGSPAIILKLCMFDTLPAAAEHRTQNQSWERLIDVLAAVPILPRTDGKQVPTQEPLAAAARQQQGWLKDFMPHIQKQIQVDQLFNNHLPA